MNDNDKKVFRILIVDDAAINIQILESILENEGYSMSFANDGYAALDQVRAEYFDLILLDVIMPGIDGFEVCRQLKEEPATRDIPVLFLTAKADAESVVNAFDIGATDFVSKPFNEAELVARVRTHLELNHSREKLKKINEQLSREIAERKHAEQRYRNMYKHAVQGMFQSTLSGRILRANPSYVRIMGYDSLEDILAIEDVGKEFYYHPEDREEIIQVLKEKGVLTNYELKIRRRNDRCPAWLLLNARLTQNSRSDLIMEGIVIDNTARKLAEEDLRYLTVHDNLTGLYNTRYLYQALGKLLEVSARDNSPFSIIFMDIDDFKHVVDTYGHLNGSRALQEVAGTIQRTLDEPAYGVAYAGDEFVVVLPGFVKAQAVEKAGEIRLRMSQTEYLADQGHPVRLRASYGISTYPDDAVDMTHLLNLADKAMFDIKKRGKDAVCVHNEE